LTRAADLGAEHGLDRQFVVRVYREIMDHSLRRQQQTLVDAANPDLKQSINVVYQGTEGSYSWLASTHFFASHKADASFRGLDSFRHILEAVRDGTADYAVLPIENTTAGSINQAYDLLARMDLVIVGEEVQRVVHCLLAPEHVPLSQIRRVYSQAPALAQCTDFLASMHDCTAVSWTDTALSCEKVAADGDPVQAAIASAEAGEIYGLKVLKRDVANQRENHTRFVVVGTKALEFDPRIPCKTSVLFATRHEEGALLSALNVLAEHGLNLTKLESRPRPNTPWEYLFYVDFEGNVADERVRKGLTALAVHTSHLKLLGSYPSRNTEEQAPAQPLPSRTTPRQRLGQGRHPLASREHRSEGTVVRVGSLVFGGSEPVILAGTASVSSAGQIRSIAEAVRAGGGHGLRGGCFKPPRVPGEPMLGQPGLLLLADAGRANELPVITEVVDAAAVDAIAQHADILQVGARNMGNVALLEAVGRCPRPVLLKRAELATLDEWLTAAEHILASGNQQVILCERGIRATGTRVVLDLGALPALRARTHLPILIDPSHAVGRDALLPVCRAALAAGAQGLLLRVEAETSPAGPTALDLSDWASFATQLLKSP